MDIKAPNFSMDLDLYKDQLLKDLAVNVLKDGLWGSYRHFPIQVFSNEPVEHAFVNTTVRGDLSSLSWLQGPVAFKSVFILLLAIILLHVLYVAILASTMTSLLFKCALLSLINFGLGKGFLWINVFLSSK